MKKSCEMVVKNSSKQSPEKVNQSQSLELVTTVILNNVVIGGFGGEDLK